MNKTEFPLGVELPLRGGGVAVLYECVDRDWFGRYRRTPKHAWAGAHWAGDGGYGDDDGLDILPPKRKAWVVWADGEAVAVALTKEDALNTAVVIERQRNMRNDPRIQEITEP